MLNDTDSDKACEILESTAEDFDSVINAFSKFEKSSNPIVPLGGSSN